ncbi:MAG: LysM peptidoglycan-binding domain-containing protein [Nitrospirae bacterium]|nr:MAG: LysM peptidoglycan-binding domain-containing protein [Nitrospirota bacterium]
MLFLFKESAIKLSVRTFLLRTSALFFCVFIFTSDCIAEVIKSDIDYKIVRGDYGDAIAGKLGLNWSYIASQNAMDYNAPLAVGQVLKVRFFRIVPEDRLDNGIIINIPDRTLYRFEKGRLKDYYFITVGRPAWPTPTGEFNVTAKAKDPVWRVPPSIQEEMEEEGKEVLEEVPPGPDNPLGKYWIQLSISGIGLHGTNAPESIYKFASHGCMRLMPEVAEFFYRDIAVGTKGRIIYRPVKLVRTDEGRVLIEVYRDFYKMGVNYQDEVMRLLSKFNAIRIVDWNKINEAIAKKDGIVRDVTK